MPTEPYNEKVCPVCGKVFVCYFAKSWTYRYIHKNQLYVMCSWTCYEKFRKDAESKQKKRGRKKREDG